MVMPVATAELCPQCGADVRDAGTRCKSCGFWLPAAPAPRTGPPLPRPAAPRDDSRRTALLVWLVGGAFALAVFVMGLAIWMRRGETEQRATAAPTKTAAPSAPAEPARLQPSDVLAEGRRQATAWHRDAVLVGIEVGPLDGEGVSPNGEMRLVYARPAGARVSGGSETAPERLILRAKAGGVTSSEERGARARIAPEPNCLFEDAWLSAQRAGANGDAGMSLHYAWSEQQGRPVWSLVGAQGEVQRRMDGVSCSILTR